MLTPEAEQILIHRLSQYGRQNGITGDIYDLKNILHFIQTSEQRKEIAGEPASKLNTFLKHPENILQIPTNEFSQIKKTLSTLGYEFNEKIKNDQTRSDFSENEALLFSDVKTATRTRWSGRPSHFRNKRPGNRS